MSLRNMHVDANVTDRQLLKLAKKQASRIKHAFKHLIANGAFGFAGVKFEDGDLNRIHSIIREIDSRRVFYYCGQDEMPIAAKASLLEARNSIRNLSSGIWSNGEAEDLVVEILICLG